VVVQLPIAIAAAAPRPLAIPLRTSERAMPGDDHGLLEFPALAALIVAMSASGKSDIEPTWTHVPSLNPSGLSERSRDRQTAGWKRGIIRSLHE
jgi:hypothetical protein